MIFKNYLNAEETYLRETLSSYLALLVDLWTFIDMTQFIKCVSPNIAL